MTVQNYPFLSTLIHELGHAFGLTHADCHGHDMDTNRSMMSSNTHLWSKGFSLSVPPPVFNPEEYLMLAQNKLAFPNFNFIPARHNPRGKSLATVDSCDLSWMDESIGEYRDMPGMGFELFYDGERINGPEAAFYTDKTRAAIAPEQAGPSTHPRHMHLQRRAAYGRSARSVAPQPAHRKLHKHKMIPTVAAAKIQSRVCSNQLSVSRAGYPGSKISSRDMGTKLANPMRAGMSVLVKADVGSLVHPSVNRLNLAQVASIANGICLRVSGTKN